MDGSASAPRVLVVVPAHDEQKTIAGVLRGLRESAPRFDRLVIDDGSVDGTAQVVSGLGERVASLPFNMGYGPVVQLGLRFMLAADYEIVVFLDADGQHDPRDVPRIVQTMINSRADVVIGSRFSEGRDSSGPFARRLGQNVFSWLTRPFIGQRVYDTTSGFKALNARASRELLRANCRDFHIEALVRLGMIGCVIEEMPIEVGKRTHGRSMYSPLAAIQYPIETLVLTLVAMIDVLLTRRPR